MEDQDRQVLASQPKADDIEADPGHLEMREVFPERYADQAWVVGMERTNPSLVGLIGRPPTRGERREWERLSQKNREELVLRKVRYLKSGLKSHMLRYLELRRDCGYIEGVPVPRWLMNAGKG